MISIKTTKKFNGISIQGDFEDLNHLYDALSEYTNFYIDGIMLEIESDYVKQHGVAIKDMTPDQREEFFTLNKHEINYFEEMRENLLGLCYDIRHAYQGDRGIGLVENGCEMLSACTENLPLMNLQFNVEVLYPWAFYYLFALRDMLDNMYKPEWFNSIGEQGVTRRESDIHLYRGVLDTFIALLWKNLEELFGKEYEAFYNYYKYKDCFSLLDRSYLTGICNYLVADYCEGLSKVKYSNFKKNMLLILAYDSVDSENLYNKQYSKEPHVIASKKSYVKALEYVNKNATRPYVTNFDFTTKILEFALKGNEKEAVAWINNLFGEADWDTFEW